MLLVPGVLLQGSTEPQAFSVLSWGKECHSTFCVRIPLKDLHVSSLSFQNIKCKWEACYFLRPIFCNWDIIKSEQIEQWINNFLNYRYGLLSKQDDSLLEIFLNFLLNLKKKNILFVCVSECHMSVNALWAQKKVLDPLELSCDLPDVGVGTQPQSL